MKTQNLGYPRIGSKRELKIACESYWKGTTSEKELQKIASQIRLSNWQAQKSLGIDAIPSNDFSFYDQVLDWSLSVGNIPNRFNALQQANSTKDSLLTLYFAMARGYQKDTHDITALEMTKWFDTNYHYLVPEFTKDQSFSLFSTKIIDEYVEAKLNRIETKPVLLGPLTYLLLGKEKETDFDRIDLLDNLLPVYTEILSKLIAKGAKHVQFDEPYLCLDLTQKQQEAYSKTYSLLRSKFPDLNITLATYFEDLQENTDLALSLPVTTLHIDLCRGPQQLDRILASPNLNNSLKLSLGVVNGRNIWKNNYADSLALIEKAVRKLGTDRVWVSASCSLLHSPCDLTLENNTEALPVEVKNWMAFAKQKLLEIVTLKEISSSSLDDSIRHLILTNNLSHLQRTQSKLIHKPAVGKRISQLKESDSTRKSNFKKRQQLQKEYLKLPLFPTTTIGSFPQTNEVRKWRSQHKKGLLTNYEYNELLKQETEETIRFQEEVGLDVLVHGEFERNDMVEYFGERLHGFAFSAYGWVQSYGSRCVKPPIIYGDVYREDPMTVEWATYAQSLSKKHVKGMLTGPVTILQWSFVRDDQPKKTTCNQIAFAIRDEVVALEKAGIKIIQIDEPAIREGLPLRKKDWSAYLDWAVCAFRISASGVNDTTQIHTHMCYSEFNDIIAHIAAMDADVITIECSRSQMELLDIFATYKYPNEIGPGVYDIHSPRIPSANEMLQLIQKASSHIPIENLWINPDCGLKTRHWPETKKALSAMVDAASLSRSLYTATPV